MAEGWLSAFGKDVEVHSAGTYPSDKVNPKATVVMKEAGVDISSNFPKSVEDFIHKSFDYVVTVCDDARERCPVFTGSVGKRMHFGFDDPTFTVGTEAEIMAAFRETRDKIKDRFRLFYDEEVKGSGDNFR